LEITLQCDPNHNSAAALRKDLGVPRPDALAIGLFNKEW